MATSLAAELKERFAIDSHLKPGHGGVFDVFVDERLVYSKKLTKRFPQPGEVGEIIAAAR